MCPTNLANSQIFVRSLTIVLTRDQTSDQHQSRFVYRVRVLCTLRHDTRRLQERGVEAVRTDLISCNKFNAFFYLLVPAKFPALRYSRFPI